MIKHTVSLRDLTPQMALAYTIVAHEFHIRALACVITSGNDSKHGITSLHYNGRALDFRTKHVSREVLITLVSDIRVALGPEFDVVLEGLGTDNEHLHVEYDPK